MTHDLIAAYEKQNELFGQQNELLKQQNKIRLREVEARERELALIPEQIEAELERKKAEEEAKQQSIRAALAAEEQIEMLQLLASKTQALLRYLMSGQLEGEFSDIRHSVNSLTSAISAMSLIVSGSHEGLTMEQIQELLRGAITRPDQVQKIGGVQLDKIGGNVEGDITGGNKS